jgi:uncharacterized membrane protein YqjE
MGYVVSLKQLVAGSKAFARELLSLGKNRFELFMVEMQEERKHYLHAVLLACAVATFGLLAGITLTAAIVLFLWAYSPVVTLLVLTVLYGAIAVYLWWRLTESLSNWQTLSASLDQLRKDNACLQKVL